MCANLAELDFWADQKSTQLCYMAASEAWERLGIDGLIGSDHYISPKEMLTEGNVGIFMTPTNHFLSRHAWGNFMEFMRVHKKT